jgi:hypothetical protein
MPPDPWKLIKLDELTPEQQQNLRAKLEQRQTALANALQAVEDALIQLSQSLSQTSVSRYKKRTLRRLGRKKKGKKR